MAWAIIAGGAISAAGAIYQANAIEAGNELNKRGIDINIRAAEINANNAIIDRLEMLEQVNADAINSANAAGSFVDASSSVQAVLNENIRKTKRATNVLSLDATTAKGVGSLNKAALDMNSKTAKVTGYLQASSTMLTAFGTQSMLGGPSGNSIPASKWGKFPNG